MFLSVVGRTPQRPPAKIGTYQLAETVGGKILELLDFYRADPAFEDFSMSSDHLVIFIIKLF